MKNNHEKKPVYSAPPFPQRPDNVPAKGSVLHVVGHPIHLITEGVHRLTNTKIEKRRLRFLVGCVFMVGGSSLAIAAPSLAIPHAAHILIDVAAYAIHGCGAVPFITIIVKKLEME